MAKENMSTRIGKLSKIFLILLFFLFAFYFLIRYGYELIYQIITFFGVNVTPTEYSEKIIVPLNLLPAIIGIVFVLFVVLLIMNILRKLGGEKGQSYGCLSIIFISSAILAVFLFVGELFQNFLNFIYDVGLPIDNTQFNIYEESLKSVTPFVILGLSLIGIYIIGKLATGLTSISQKFEPSESEGTISSLLNAVVKILGQVFKIVGILAEIIEQLIDGLLKSIQLLYDLLEQILEMNLVRIIISVSLFVVCALWNWFLLYFTSEYLISGNLFNILWIILCILLSFLSQVGFWGVIRRNDFRILALHQAKVLGLLSGFIILFYLVLLFILSKINIYINFGPISYSILAVFLLLIFYEIGRRMQSSKSGGK